MGLRLLILFCFYGSIYSKAQIFTQNKVDSLTYIQFTLGDYSSLLETGNLALKHNVDFYYLRMRMGIATFEQKEYTTAKAHFEKALTFSANDTNALFYLYYTYIQTGELVQARALLYNAPHNFSLKNILATYQHLAIGVETGYSVTNNLNGKNSPESNADIKQQGMYTYRGGIFYLSALARYDVKKRMTLFGVASFSNSLSLSVFLDRANKIESLTYSNNHFQFTGGFNYTSPKKWSFSTTIGYFSIGSSVIIPQLDFRLRRVNLIEEVHANGYVAFMQNIAKRLKHVEPVLSLGYTNMYKADQYQAQLDLNWFPLQQARLCIVPSVAGTFSGNNINPVLGLRTGYQFTPKLYVEGMFLNGNLSNYMLSSGLVIYNAFDPVKSVFGGDVEYRFKKSSIGFAYRYQLKKGLSGADNIDLRPYTYNNQFLIFSYKWNF